MGVTVVGVSLQPKALALLDRFAKAEGLARSTMIARLVEEEASRRRAGRQSEPPDVRVDGVRFVPARNGR